MVDSQSLADLRKYATTGSLAMPATPIHPSGRCRTRNLASDGGRPGRRGYQAHLSIVCLMDTGDGVAMVYRGRKRNVVIPLPIVGHWMKQAWGSYARLTKLGHWMKQAWGSYARLTKLGH